MPWRYDTLPGENGSGLAGWGRGGFQSSPQVREFRFAVGIYGDTLAGKIVHTGVAGTCVGTWPLGTFDGTYITGGLWWSVEV